MGTRYEDVYAREEWCLCNYEAVSGCETGCKANERRREVLRLKPDGPDGWDGLLGLHLLGGRLELGLRGGRGL